MIQVSVYGVKVDEVGIQWLMKNIRLESHITLVGTQFRNSAGAYVISVTDDLCTIVKESFLPDRPITIFNQGKETISNQWDYFLKIANWNFWTVCRGEERSAGSKKTGKGSGAAGWRDSPGAGWPVSRQHGGLPQPDPHSRLPLCPADHIQGHLHCQCL